MKNRSRLTTITLLLLFVLGCTDQPAHDESDVPIAAASAIESSDEFGDYWYEGTAELTSYDLKQARYGELRDGHAVLVFVTEDFSRSKLVKLNNPDRAGSDAVKVMKLNLTKKFNTGIYPYSMMSSVFTPVQPDVLPTLKVTTTSQEWCGHTFARIALENSGYSAHVSSYFEDEDVSDKTLGNVRLEDEVWNTIRLNPGNLPTGSFEMVPGQLYQRLGHIALQPYRAEAEVSMTDDTLTTYTIRYPDLDRSLSISFATTFPHTIEQWKETHTSGFGEKATTLTTTATRRARVMTDYWNKNAVTDSEWRSRLGLDSPAD